MRLIPHHQDDRHRREYRSPDGTWRVVRTRRPGGNRNERPRWEVHERPEAHAPWHCHAAFERRRDALVFLDTTVESTAALGQQPPLRPDRRQAQRLQVRRQMRGLDNRGRHPPPRRRRAIACLPLTSPVCPGTAAPRSPRAARESPILPHRHPRSRSSPAERPPNTTISGHLRAVPEDVRHRPQCRGSASPGMRLRIAAIAGAVERAGTAGSPVPRAAGRARRRLHDPRADRPELGDGPRRPPPPSRD